MAKVSVDKPIEDTNDILDPVTVKVGADDDDEDTDAEDEAPPPRAALPEERDERPPQERGTPERGAAPAQKQPGQKKGERPSSWKGFIQKLFTEHSSKSEQTIQQLRQQIAEMNGRFQGMQQPAQAQQQGPTEAEQIRQQMMVLATSAAAPDLSAEQRNTLAKQYAALEDKLLDLRAGSVVDRKLAEFQQQLQQNQPSANEMAGRTIVATEFPRLNTDQNARQEASAYYWYLVQKNGGEESAELLRLACQQVYTDRGWPVPGFRLDNSRSRGMHETAGGAGRGATQNGYKYDFSQKDQRMIGPSGLSLQEVAEYAEKMRRGEV